jgi:hypothetical protein
VATDTATAQTYNIDRVKVYEGTVEPTSFAQEDGRGAVPPFGIIGAEARDPSASTGWATVTEGSGDTLLIQSALGASGAIAEWFIDPSLIPPDRYTGSEVQVEVWARLSVNVSPIRAIASVLPATGVGNERFTNEFGSAGKTVQPQGNTEADYRTIRLGVLPMRSDSNFPARWKLRTKFINASATTSDIALDEIYLVPVARRALSPTGKTNDATYPTFISAAPAIKKISPDLSGQISAGPGDQGFFPDSGLGGEPLEFEPGLIRFFMKLTDHVPDDPTTTTTESTVAAAIRFLVVPRWNLLRGSG